MKLAVDSLPSLFLDDETAWLEQMAQRIEERRYEELDYTNLREYLLDMARRDRREVMSRLVTLIVHRLKWEFQPEMRSKSWLATVAEQRRELEDLLESGTLRNHASEVLAKAYAHAVEQAALETGLEEKAFPSENMRTLDEWLSKEGSS